MQVSVMSAQSLAAIASVVAKSGIPTGYVVLVVELDNTPHVSKASPTARARYYTYGTERADIGTIAGAVGAGYKASVGIYREATAEEIAAADAKAVAAPAKAPALSIADRMLAAAMAQTPDPSMASAARAAVRTPARRK